MEKLTKEQIETLAKPLSKDNGDPSIGWTEGLGESASFPATPSTSGEDFYALGQWWKVSADERRICAAFEQWVRRNATLLIQETERDGDFDEADKLRSVFVSDRGAGYYSFEGRACRNALKDWKGLKYLLYLALLRCQPDITEEIVEKMFRENAKNCGQVIGWVLGNLKSPSKSEDGVRG